MGIIERNEEEYMEEMKDIYWNEVKPLLNKGYSLTKAFNTVGINGGRGARKCREIRELALKDGYKLRRRN